MSVSKDPQYLLFSELFAYLSDQLAEDLTTKYPNLGERQPVFTGSYTKDPLLFANPNLSLDQANSQLKRYSREYVLRRTRGLPAVLLAGMVFLAGCYYTLLDKTQYALANSDGVIEIYRGRPGYNILGFPRLLWKTDIPVNEATSTGRLRKNGYLLSPLGESIDATLLAELNPP